MPPLTENNRYLPKTVKYNLPGTRPPNISPTELLSQVNEAIEKEEGNVQPSLFLRPRTEVTPPHTPLEGEVSDPYGNEDGLRVQLPRELKEPPRGGPADRSSPTWGARHDQPSSRASSPPPACLIQSAIRKAEALGRRGIVQPRSSIHRSDSHDRVFQNASWRITSSDQGNGGLRNAADAAARESDLGDYTWVGTLGMPTGVLTPEQKQEIEDKLVTEHDMVPVFCDDTDFDGHYAQFCKQILWPVFHYQIPDNPKSKAYEDHSWKHYEKVNQAFADTIVRNWKRGDVIWIHDYHLLLVPRMVRARLPDAKIGFFLHVAFPSSEIFRCLAMRKKLLEGMLGSNLIGFHIHEYTRHFLQTCSRLLNVEATTDGLELEDRFVDVVNLAIGIDAVNLARGRQDEEVHKWIEVLQDRYKGKKLIVARDKLDNVRGVRQKLLSFELFLNKNPEWQGKIVLIQVALSTSEKSELHATVSDIVTRVNSAWANLAYQPVVYLRQDIDYAQYLALLTMADALMITSQREGMNLTSHEFIVCQDGKSGEGKQHGSLILSEFTGTTSIFGGNELAINPWDYRACSDAIKKALEMDDAEKERRWTNLHDAVLRHTGAHWFSEFLARLDRVYDEQHRRDNISVPRLSMSNLIKQYKRSSRRLFILDYEGTLVSWGPVNQIIPVSPQVGPAKCRKPRLACASCMLTALQRPLDVLNDLLLDASNTVFVMSGRRPEELDRLFKRVANLGLIAENGCFLKDCGAGEWTEISDPKHTRKWKQSVQGIMTYYLERTPGSKIEERRCSLIFHYKSAEDYDSAERQAADCAAHINDACEELRVHAIPMDGSIIVEPVDWTKMTAASKIFEDLKGHLGSDETHAGPVDFLMVVGDGREDEKVFKWANTLSQDKSIRDVVTVSLGSRSTEATATLTQGVSGKTPCL